MKPTVRRGSALTIGPDGAIGRRYWWEVDYGLYTRAFHLWSEALAFANLQAVTRR